MSLQASKYRHLSLLLGVLAAISIMVVLIYMLVQGFIGHEYKVLARGARVGWTSQQVRSHLGTPTRVLRSQVELSRVASGWYPLPTRPIEKEVLEYDGFIWRIYVYIDKRDHVSYTLMSQT